MATGMEASNSDKHPNDVVISGVSCRLPESDSVEEFWQHLINGEDMVTEDDRRWKPGLFGLPKRNGKLKDLSRFDAEFFRANRLQAHAMDPQLRILVEVAYEAIVDAGLDPSELRGSPTGVYVGVMFTEALEASGNLHSKDRIGYGLSGGNSCMMSNYLSFCFDFRGPSLTVNTACAASLYAMDSACRDLRSSRCRYAVVAGSNIMLKPATAVHLNRLRMISPDGTCKTFDAAANGYARSEGVVAVLLTERRNARRAYLQVLNCRSSFDGYKPEGITYPSGAAQGELIRATFAEAGVDPTDVFYVEAHGTGTQAGDFEECKSLDETICCCRVRVRDRDVQTPSTERAHNSPPLLVGSVKSNIGHSEPVSGLAGIVKVILAIRHGKIPPNLHFNSPNPKIASIIEGRLSVVTQATPIPPSAVVSLNAFGFGGAISHVILRGERKPVSMDQKLTDNVTLAFPVASRTAEGLAKLMDFVVAHRDEKEVLVLLQPVMSAPHINRGYLLWKAGSHSGFEPRKTIADTGSSVGSTRSRKRPVWFVFCGMGSQWSGMGQDLLQYPVFRQTIERCYAALPPDVRNVITTGGLNDSCSVLDETTAICVVSLALFEMLRVVGIVPDGLIGHSLGEVSACCADGCLTLEQAVQLIFWRAKCISDANIPPGAMAAAGLTWEEAERRCPEGVWPACNNIQGVIKNVTVAGEEKAVEKFVAQLKAEGTFAKVVKSAGLAFHSPHMRPLLNNKALETLGKIIPEPKYQSPKWIVTSVPPDRAQSEPVLCSAEFHLKSTVSQVFFHEAIKKIPRDAVVIEIGPHAILQAILKKGLSPEATLLPLQNLKEDDQAVVFMRTLGECYNAGVSLNPLALLEPIDFPVGAQTPGIGHLVSWNHSDEWLVPKPEDFSIQSRGGSSFATADSKVTPDEEYKVDGSSAVPAAHYLLLAWKTLAEFYGEPHTKVPVTFSDVTFHESYLDRQGDLDAPMQLNALVSPISGHFEITEGQNLLVSGTLRRQTDTVSPSPEPSSSEVSSTEFPSSLHGVTKLTQQDIYKELSLKGYQMGQQFQTLTEASLDISECLTQPGTASWLHLLDAPFQAALLGGGSGFSLPATIKSVRINPLVLDKLGKTETQLKLRCSPQEGMYTTPRVSVEGLQLLPRERKLHGLQPQIEKYTFHPYLRTAPITENDISEQLRYMVDVVIENTGRKEVSILQVISADVDWSLASHLSETAKSRSMRQVVHNVVVAGEAVSKPEGLQLSGSISHVESLSSTAPPDVHHNMVVADTTSQLGASAPHLLKKIHPGGFFLLKETLPTDRTTELTQDGSHVRLDECFSRDLKDLDFCHVATRLYHDEETNTKGALLLYRRLNSSEIPDSEMAFVRVEAATRQFDWILELQTLLSGNKDSHSAKRIYCISEVDSASPSGLIGMINCLRLEPHGDRLRCLYLVDGNWESFRSTAVWQEVRRLDLVMNVISGGETGSFRHSPIKTAITETTSTPVQVLSTVPSRSTNPPRPTSTSRKFICDPDKVYVITGGLGGFGLELATWLVERGAKQLCLTSRSGVKSGYQARKLRVLTSQGAKVEVSKLDASDVNQAETLVRTVAKNLGGIFHLAGVLKDGLFENQTAENFEAVVGPKLTSAVNLDRALRTQSVDSSALFVVFSSVASGFGNIGQSNYAFANSAMDRLCEQRRGRGLHGLAVQWGAIGGVGMLQGKTGNVESIAGTRLQPISSCLEALDVLLSSTSAVISCYVPAEISSLVSPSRKQTRTAEDGFKTALCQIIGLRNPEQMSEDTTLGELGMDSVMSFEVTQLVEKDCGISLSKEELLSVKVGTLIEKAVGATLKPSTGSTTTPGTSGFKASLCDILGLPDPGKLSDEATLSQLGLDSLMSFEIRQLLVEEYDTTLTKEELPAMTVSTLMQKTSQQQSATDADTATAEIPGSTDVSALPDGGSDQSATVADTAAEIPGSTDVSASPDGGSDQSAVCSASSSVTGLDSPPKVTPAAEE